MNASSFELETGRIVRGRRPWDGEGLRQRVMLLEPRDRLLVELAAAGTLSLRRMAEIVGIGPGTISRRLARVGARLHDPLVIRLLGGCPLGPEYRQIGVEHFLTGWPLARIAREHRMTIAAVREAIGYVRTWHRVTREGGEE